MSEPLPPNPDDEHREIPPQHKRQILIHVYGEHVSYDKGEIERCWQFYEVAKNVRRLAIDNTHAFMKMGPATQRELHENYGVERPPSAAHRHDRNRNHNAQARTEELKLEQMRMRMQMQDKELAQTNVAGRRNRDDDNVSTTSVDRNVKLWDRVKRHCMASIQNEVDSALAPSGTEKERFTYLKSLIKTDIRINGCSLATFLRLCGIELKTYPRRYQVKFLRRIHAIENDTQLALADLLEDEKTMAWFCKAQGRSFDLDHRDELVAVSIADFLSNEPDPVVDARGRPEVIVEDTSERLSKRNTKPDFTIRWDDSRKVMFFLELKSELTRKLYAEYLQMLKYGGRIEQELDGTGTRVYGLVLKLNGRKTFQLSLVSMGLNGLEFHYTAKVPMCCANGLCVADVFLSMVHASPRQSGWYSNVDELELTGLCGIGSESVVCGAVCQSNKESFAVKFYKNEMAYERAMRAYGKLKEIGIKASSSGSHCIDCPIREDRPGLYAVFNFCIPKVTLLSLATEPWQIFAEQLSHLHSCGFIHRDIKPGNMLLDLEEHRICLTDVGGLLKYDSQRNEEEREAKDEDESFLTSWDFAPTYCDATSPLWDQVMFLRSMYAICKPMTQEELKESKFLEVCSPRSTLELGDLKEAVKEIGIATMPMNDIPLAAQIPSFDSAFQPKTAEKETERATGGINLYDDDGDVEMSAANQISKKSTSPSRKKKRKHKRPIEDATYAPSKRIRVASEQLPRRRGSKRKQSRYECSRCGYRRVDCHCRRRNF